VRLVGIEFDHLFVFVERQRRNSFRDGMKRAVVVGVRDAEPFVETATCGQKLRMMTEVPFAERRGGVALLLEEFAEELFPRMQAGRAGVVQGAAHADAIGITAGHQCRARRGADRLRNIETREPRALRGETIDVRRADVFRAVTTDIAVAKIVGEDEHDVRFWSDRGRG
jgi:hypothetical protein